MPGKTCNAAAWHAVQEEHKVAVGGAVLGEADGSAIFQTERAWV